MSWAQCVALALCLLLGAGGTTYALQMPSVSNMATWWQAATRSPPSFPAAFEAEYTFALPYVQVVQSLGLSFPVHVWYDGNKGRMRLDVYDGLDSLVQTDDDTMYTVYPRLNRTVCDAERGEVGPTANGGSGAAALGKALLQDAPLPDLDGWRYSGAATLRGERADVWVLREKLSEDKTATYSFYVSQRTGAPLRLYMMGANIIQYSHIDEYLVDFTAWRPGRPASSVFAVPNGCPEPSTKAGGVAAPQQQQVPSARAARVAQAAALMPWSRIARPAAASAATSTAPPSLLLRRAAARAQSVAFVRAHDARAAGYSVALNRFSDWTHEEYALLATARRRAPRRAAGGSARRVARPLGVFTARDIDVASLPRTVDWRGTAAVGVVKDQATCGSCWAFAATGTMEGAWAVATGDALSLSEQQLVDCTWDYGPEGCGGGEMEPAIQYIADAGGAISEEDYQYAGQNMFCGVNATVPGAKPAAKFAGFAQVEPRSEKALMAAVARLGPVAVSIDASDMGFKYFSDGVYGNPKCSNDDLDHAVLLVGYGTTDAGVPYWLIKNSWSTLWGSNGYVKMLRTPGSGVDCGITTDPVVAVVHPRAAAAAAARMGRRAAPAPVLEKPAGGAGSTATAR